MATKSKTPETAGKVKFRVIEFELEGTDASLQESLKNLAVALGRGSAMPPARQIKAPTTRQVESNGDLDPESEAEDAEVVDEEEAAAPARSSAPRKPARVKTYSIIPDLRFDDVNPTLKEFATQKSPSGDLKKYLVIAYWFKYHKKHPNLTPEHFYTAYKEMKWAVPRNPAQPVRELRSNRDQRLGKGTEPGTSVINQIGENDVDALGKSV